MSSAPHLEPVVCPAIEPVPESFIRALDDYNRGRVVDAEKASMIHRPMRDMGQAPIPFTDEKQTQSASGQRF